MYADDMFLDGVQQVFSVRTGDFIGYRGMIEAEEQPEIPVPIPVKDEAQLSIIF